MEIKCFCVFFDEVKKCFCDFVNLSDEEFKVFEEFKKVVGEFDDFKFKYVEFMGISV